MLRWVYPDGRVTATGVRANSTACARKAGRNLRIAITPVPALSGNDHDPAIEIDGDVAMVWAPFVVRVGGKVSNCGIDHFDLVRENGAWKS